jgi:hypothetical protein
MSVSEIIELKREARKMTRLLLALCEKRLGEDKGSLRRNILPWLLQRWFYENPLMPFWRLKKFATLKKTNSLECIGTCLWRGWRTCLSAPFFWGMGVKKERWGRSWGKSEDKCGLPLFPHYDYEHGRFTANASNILRCFGPISV